MGLSHIWTFAENRKKNLTNKKSPVALIQQMTLMMEKLQIYCIIITNKYINCQHISSF